MANKLTGDYEAVLQVRLRRINGILANLHQAETDPAAPLHSPHSTSFRLGDYKGALRHLPEDRMLFMEWVSGAVDHVRESAAGEAGVRTFISTKIPPVWEPTLDQAWRDLDLKMIKPGDVRGWADCQISNPTVTIPSGSESQVTVQVGIRARFKPDDGAAGLPEPIHGDIEALYTVTPRTKNGHQTLRIRVTDDDSQITFQSNAPLKNPPVHTEVIAKQVRSALRDQFVAVDVEIPDDFAFSGFKGLPSNPEPEALVLPLSLSGAELPVGALGTVNDYFLGQSDDFAVAVGKESLQDLTESVKQSIRTAVKDISFSAKVADIVVTRITFSVTNVEVNWKPGHIEIAVSAHIHVWTPLTDDDVDFTVVQKLVLAVQGQVVSVQPDGEPNISIPGWENQLKSARDQALREASDAINQQLALGRDTLDSVLHKFDSTGSAEFTSVEVTDAGLIVRGSLETKIKRVDAIVPDPAKVLVHGSKARSAWACWIPGGRIESFEWTWTLDGFPVRKESPIEDVFTCAEPSQPFDSVCLRISGRRLTVKGKEEPMTGIGNCSYWSHAPFVTVAPWKAQLVLPLHWYNHGDPAPRVVMSARHAGHVSVVKDLAALDSVTANVLVHFTGSHPSRPLEELARARAMLRRRDVSLLTVVVLPAGGLDVRRSEIEERLGLREEGVGGPVVLTEDYAGGWSRTFAASDGPSTHLVNARSEFVWRHDGDLDAGAVARALDELALPAPPPQRVLLRLRVRPGARARDTVFTDEDGGYTSILRLRGRQVRLLFWQSWSVPCLLELRRLEQAREERGAPLILAVNGGEDREVLAEVRRANGFVSPFIYDPGQRIAALYGVRCWPTTVSINEAGIVERVQFGLTHAANERTVITSPDGPVRTEGRR